MAAGSGYKNNFTGTDGSPIYADLFSNEYNALEIAFNKDTGHTHDGSPENGAFISLLSDYQNKNTIEIIGGTNNEIILSSNFNGTMTPQLRLVHGTLTPMIPDLSLGDYQSRFEDLHVSGRGTFGILEVGYTNPNANPPETVEAPITGIFKTPDLIENSDEALATQKAIKTYVDTSVANSIGIFNQSYFVPSATDQASTGGLLPYISIDVFNLKAGDKVHIFGTITAEGTAAQSSPAGAMYCNITKDGTPLIGASRDFVIFSTTNTTDTTSGSASLAFRNDITVDGDYTFAIALREWGLALSTGKATNGTLLVLVEPGTV